MKKFTPVIITSFTSLLSLWSTNYHVDQTSAQTLQDGSFSAPFRTIQQASEVLEPGDTCIIHKGIYRETLAPQSSGTATAPITYIAYQKEDVVISGTEVVEDWELYEGSIYKATHVSMSMGDQHMVYYNSAAQQLARWPNDLDGNPYTYDAYKIKTEQGTYSNSYITHDDIPNYWNEGVMFWLGAHSGCAVQRRITGYNIENHRLSFTPFPSNWPFGTHSPTRMEAGHRGQFYLMNHLEALDHPGEWYYDADTQSLYFYAPNGEIPSHGTVEIAARERTLNSSNSYIRYQNINFFGAPIQLNGNHQILNRLRIKNCVNGLITDNRSATAGSAAVLVYGSNIRIENTLVEEGSATGVNIGMSAENTIVKNCIVRNFDKQGNHCSPIRSSGPASFITQSRFYGSARDCTRVTGRDSEFSYNEVSDGLLSCTDGGLFYVTGNSTPINVELHHNWFYNAYSPDYTNGKSTGIYLDNDSAGFKVHHNVVWDINWGGLHFNWDALDNEIYNNTFWNVGFHTSENERWATILCWVPERNGIRTNVRNNTLINNLSDVRDWWDSRAGSFSVDETLDNTFINNVQVEHSPFISMADKNFVPINAPTIIDRGQPIEGITTDVAGMAPDVGAYENGKIRWIPGPDWTPDDFSWLIPTNSGNSPQKLVVNDFTVAPGQVVFGNPEQGEIRLKQIESYNNSVPVTSSTSPLKLIYEWSGLDLDGIGESDDVITFTLVVEGSLNAFGSYSNILASFDGWGVMDEHLSKNESLRFKIEYVSLSENTQGNIQFSGFTGVQCKKTSDVFPAEEASVWINRELLSFTESDQENKRKGLRFHWPVTTAHIAYLSQSEIDLTVSALNFEFSFQATP